VERRHIDRFAEAASLSPAAVRRRLLRFARGAHDVAQEQLSSVRKERPVPGILEAVTQLVVERASRLEGVLR
jgi:hypothetical protein